MNEELDPHGENVGAAGIATPETPATPDVVVSEDGNQITRGEHKYIRAEALQQERARRQEAERVLGQLEPVLPEFQEFLQNKRGNRQGAVREAAQPAGEDYTEDELKAVAELNRYYSDDGATLDLTRARQALDLMSRISDRRVSRAVEPVVRTTAADRAARNRQEALSQQYVDGAPIADAAFVEQAFNALPPELVADPGVAKIVQIVAAGMEYLDKRRTGKIGTGREPQFSEGSTGRFNGNNGRGLSAFALRAAQARGYTPEQWAKMQDKPTPQARPDRDGGYVLETGVD